MLKISDIAGRVGVSATTVSLVLNEGPDGSPRVSHKTRQKVLQAAEEMGYRSNRLARAMRTGNTKMLGILGGLPAEEHVGRMLEGALEAADAHGYTLKLLRLHAIGNSPQQAIRSISELRLMGVVALHLPGDVVTELHAEATKSGTPLVLMDTRNNHSHILQTTSDDAGGIGAAVDHLVGLGHTQIAMINGGGQDAISVQRRSAFEAALHRHNIDNAVCVLGSFRGQEASLEAAHALLELPKAQRPTALFCASDFIAMAALKAAHNLRIEVPSELSVIGFDNFKFSEYLTPSLTTVEQPFREIGATAVNTLLQVIEHLDVAPGGHYGSTGDRYDLPGDTTDYKKQLPTQLIVRQSTAPPPR